MNPHRLPTYAEMRRGMWVRFWMLYVMECALVVLLIAVYPYLIDGWIGCAVLAYNVFVLVRGAKRCVQAYMFIQRIKVAEREDPWAHMRGR